MAVLLLLQRGALRDLRRELEAARQDMYRGQYDTQETLHRIERDLKLLNLEQRAHEGTLPVGPSTTVGEALDLHPKVQHVLDRFHIDHAGAAAGETLAAAAASYSQDLEKLLAAIHDAVEHPERVQPPLTEPAGDSFTV